MKPGEAETESALSLSGSRFQVDSDHSARFPIIRSSPRIASGLGLVEAKLIAIPLSKQPNPLLVGQVFDRFRRVSNIAEPSHCRNLDVGGGATGPDARERLRRSRRRGDLLIRPAYWRKLFNHLTSGAIAPASGQNPHSCGAASELDNGRK